VLSLAAAGLAYGLAGTLEGSGFLSVYLTGLILGTGTTPARRAVAAFHEGLGWVAQLTMFFTLGLLVFPSALPDIALEGAAVALLLALVARPLAVAVSTLPFGFAPREQLLLGWAGLRGAVPVVLATFPVIAEVPGSGEYFNIVFFAVLFSTVLQGATFEPIARRLGLTSSEPAL
jgi:cell volume regulation protein A